MSGFAPNTKRPLGLTLPLLCAAILLTSLTAATAAPARDISTADRNRGVQLASEGRCAAALDLLDRIWESEPLDLEATRLAGECAVRLERFGVAVDALRAAHATDPDDVDTRLALGIAEYHAGDLDAADASLDPLSVEGARGAEVGLYKGLIALALADHARAAAAFESARRLDSLSTDGPRSEPMSSFYGGLAYEGAGERERAIESLRRVVTEWPGTPWAAQAQEALDALEDDEPIPMWANVQIGFEHDDNVLLRGSDVSRPVDISGQSDIRGIWGANAGIEFLRLDETRGGIALRYSGSEQEDLHDFDQHGTGGTLWLDRALPGDRDALRLQFDFDAYWVDDESFLWSPGIRLTEFHTWKEAGASSIYIGYVHDEYRFSGQDELDGPGMVGAPCFPPANACGPLGLDESDARERDGDAIQIGITHQLPTLPFGILIDGEARYQRFWAGGSEYSHDAIGLRAGASIPLPFDISLAIRGGYAYRIFDDASTFADPERIVAAPGTQYKLDAGARKEHETEVSVEIRRPITRFATLSAGWTRWRNRSRSDVYDYRRDIVGMTLCIGGGC